MYGTRTIKIAIHEFRLCDKALWLGVFKLKEAVIDDAAKERFAAGIEIGEVAKGLLGDHEDMTSRRPDGSLDYGKMIEKTADAVARGVENICEETRLRSVHLVRRLPGSPGR